MIHRIQDCPHLCDANQDKPTRTETFKETKGQLIL